METLDLVQEMIGFSSCVANLERAYPRFFHALFWRWQGGPVKAYLAVGAVVQLHFFLDDTLPTILCKPIF